MYVNPEFLEPDLDEVVRLIDAHPFGTFIAARDEIIIANAPVTVRRDGGRILLESHVAAPDPMAVAVREQLPMTFSIVQPNAYVSPAWYHDRGLPTYNFVAIELRGTARPITDVARIKSHLMSLVTAHESRRSDPWRVDEWARARTDELLGELQAFRVTTDSYTAKVKVGQNRTPADRRKMLGELAESAGSHEAELADLMRSRFDASGEPRR